MQGIRVVQEGQSIDFVEPVDISYSSEFQSPKVATPYAGTFITDSNGNGSVAVSHPLSYRPTGEAYYKVPTQKWRKIDNDFVGLEMNTNNFVLRLRKINPGIDTPIAAFVSTTVQYKVWLKLDPSQEIIG